MGGLASCGIAALGCGVVLVGGWCLPSIAKCRSSMGSNVCDGLGRTSYIEDKILYTTDKHTRMYELTITVVDLEIQKGGFSH